MRIGEILVEKRWVEPAALRRVLADQKPGQKRTCSLLIARGLLDPDDAARALAEQHGVSGVLQRHFEYRDDSLAQLLPAEVARRRVALPIGRNRNGDLIICLRDPSAEARAELAAVIAGPILIAVAPATLLEQLVAKVYPENAVEIRGLETMRTMELGTLKLVELDDVRVVKDASQAALPRTNTGTSGLPPAPPEHSATTVPPRRASGPSLPASSPRTMTGPAIPRTTSGLAAALPPTLDATIAALDHATTREDATATAMRFVAGRWTHAILLAIQGATALGYRGHGAEATDEAVRSIRISLSTPTVVKLACDAKRLVTSPGDASALGEPLARVLGHPAECSAVPIRVGGQIACVLAVGAVARGGPGDATTDLALLASALADAYERQLRGTRP